MTTGSLAVALVHDVFWDSGGDARLRTLLSAARRDGAELALLPELPLDPWVPTGRTPRDEDAEPPGGPRHRRLAAAARESGVAIAGGAIVVDAESNARRNRALLFDARGSLVASYDKLHVPNEEGFWEAEHYEGGEALPRPLDGHGLRIGLQICSDLFRPAGCHLLGAAGAEAILAPRATPATSYPRWREIIRADAITSCCYVLSANRPRPEADVPIGGPSLAVAPDGRVLVESTDPVTIVRLDRAVVETARRDYPGYLPVRADLYARGWSQV